MSDDFIFSLLFLDSIDMSITYNVALDSFSSIKRNLFYGQFIPIYSKKNITFSEILKN